MCPVGPEGAKGGSSRAPGARVRKSAGECCPERGGPGWRRQPPRERGRVAANAPSGNPRPVRGGRPEARGPSRTRRSGDRHRCLAGRKSHSRRKKGPRTTAPETSDPTATCDRPPRRSRPLLHRAPRALRHEQVVGEEKARDPDVEIGFTIRSLVEREARTGQGTQRDGYVPAGHGVVHDLVPPEDSVVVGSGLSVHEETEDAVIVVEEGGLGLSAVRSRGERGVSRKRQRSEGRFNHVCEPEPRTLPWSRARPGVRGSGLGRSPLAAPSVSPVGCRTP